MKELNHCPSTLADGFSTYSPTACKKLFDGQKVSAITHLVDTASCFSVVVLMRNY